MSQIDDFDFTDVDIDNVTDILDVAVSVLQDYDPDHGPTRIERLARFVALNMRNEVKGGDHEYEHTCIFDGLGPTSLRRLATHLIMLAYAKDFSA